MQQETFFKFRKQAEKAMKANMRIMGTVKRSSGILHTVAKLFIRSLIVKI